MQSIERTTVVSGELCFPEPTAALYGRCEDNDFRTTKLHFPEDDAAAKGLPGHSFARTEVLLPAHGRPLLVPDRNRPLPWKGPLIRNPLHAVQLVCARSIWRPLALDYISQNAMCLGCHNNN